MHDTVVDVSRHGILPGDPGLAGKNATALRRLLDPTLAGPRARVIFPAAAPGAVYHFNDWIQIRDGIELDLCWNKLRYSKILSAADRSRPFLHGIRDVRIRNGEIEVDVSGTGVLGGGIAVCFGSRSGTPFGAYSKGVFDLTDLVERGLPPMGNCWLEDLSISSNNSSSNANAIVLMLGGLLGGGARRVSFTGAFESGPESGITYEFGFASQNGRGYMAGDLPHWTSSHARDLEFESVSAQNLKKNGNADAHTILLTEAWSARATNIHSRNCYGTFQSRVGEAHFYRPWVPGAPGARRTMELRHLSSQNAAGVAVLLNSSQHVGGGYLKDDRMDLARLPRLNSLEQGDLMEFLLDGFSLSAAVGIVADGKADIRNGVTRGCVHGIHVSGECRDVSLVNVHLLDSLDIGLRANNPPELLTGRKKVFTLRDSRICGSRKFGVALDWVREAQIRNCQIGYHGGLDAKSEATQDVGVLVAHDGENVRCERNLVTTSGGAAYVLAGAGPRGCRIEDARGSVRTSGEWIGRDAEI